MTIELTFIPAILVILLAAVAGRLLSMKIGQPEILGELILGVIVGSFVVLSPGAQEPVSALAEIGILILLFSVGLDLDWGSFKEQAFPASGAATGGIILPFILGYAAGTYFDFSSTEALFIGTSLVATSVGIGGSILHESGKLKTKIGALIMNSAVTDDVIGIIIMTVLFSFATTGALPWIDIVLLAVFSVLFFGLSLTIGIKALGEISERIPIRGENLLLGGLIVLISFALIAQEIGLAGIIGAFVAGITLGQTHFARSLPENVSLIGKGFFIPIFFVFTGMSFDLAAFTSIGSFAAVLILLGVLGKILGCGFGAKAFGFSNRESLTTGIAMIPRAEVALITANFGLTHGLIGQDTVSAIIVLVIVSTLITPPLLWIFIGET